MTLRFGGDFEIDPRGRCLRRAGRTIRLERIPMEILLMLIEHHDEVVSREQIAERVWGAGVFLDTDNSIRGAIRKIRQALRDDADQPRFVQTVTGRGYRFIAALQPADDVPPTEAAPAEAAPARAEAVPQAVERTTPVRRRKIIEIAAALVLVSLAAAAWLARLAIKPGPARTPVAPVAATESMEAHDLYLRGRFFWNQRTPQAFERAADLFNQAIVRAPGYAPAYAGLADTYTLMVAYDAAAHPDLLPKARAAALRAVAVDDSLAEGHTSLGLIAADADHDFAAAEREYLRAIALNPNYATAHHWYGELLAFLGRFDESFREFDRARELDPLSLVIANDRAVALLYARQYDRSVEAFQRVLDADPNFARASMIVYPYLYQRRYADAIARADLQRKLNNRLWDWAVLTYAYGRSGDLVHARASLAEFERRCGHDDIAVAPAAAIAYLGVGDTARALTALEKEVALGAPNIDTLNVDPMYDSLRGDPRFTALLRRAGFRPQG